MIVVIINITQSIALLRINMDRIRTGIKNTVETILKISGFLILGFKFIFFLKIFFCLENNNKIISTIQLQAGCKSYHQFL